MRLFRVPVALALLSSLTGCGYIHFGRLPSATTATGDAGISEAYTNLATEHKILKQELAIVRKEGDAIRTALERGPGAASPEILAQLTATSRELTTLRASYAKLQAGRAGADATGDASSAARLSELEEKLAGSLRNYTWLQEENTRLRSDIDRARTENSTLTSQLKMAASENEQAQITLAQLNTELLAQKDARARAEQATAAAHTQLGAVLARHDPPASAARDAATSAAGGATSPISSALALTKAPPAELSAIAELRTSPDRVRQDPSANRMHVVQAGETLSAIAEKYYADEKLWVKIYAANNELLRDGRPLNTGMELIIPPK